MRNPNRKLPKCLRPVTNKEMDKVLTELDERDIEMEITCKECGIPLRRGEIDDSICYVCRGDV